MSVDSSNEEEKRNRTEEPIIKPTVIKIHSLSPARNSTLTSPPLSGRNVTKINLNALDERRDLAVAPSYRAIKDAVCNLYRIDDFILEKIGIGFFSEVFKVVHKVTGKVMVLKLNKHRSNRANMLKEVQLMNRFGHPNILRLEAACVNNGQIHALTEYIDGGNLEQLIQKKDRELPWGLRMSLALDVAKGLAYLHSRGIFHRDLTSKNILIRSGNGKFCNGYQRTPSCGGAPTALIGDFGLSTQIPKACAGSDYPRLSQVGSPYWMSPECLKGKFYDEKTDIFSFGIVTCELIGKMEADPDVLPRTENFGVDYIAFSELCPECPPDFLKLAFTCVRIDPQSRPAATELQTELEHLMIGQKENEAEEAGVAATSAPTGMRDRFSSGADARTSVRSSNSPRNSLTKNDPTLPASGGKRSLSETSDDNAGRTYATPLPPCRNYSSPSEKARLHYRQPLSSVKSVGKEMSLRDPHYRPMKTSSNANESESPIRNPFLALPLLKEGSRKILVDESSLPFSGKSDLFSSCFELPSPARVATPVGNSNEDLTEFSTHFLQDGSNGKIGEAARGRENNSPRSLPSSPNLKRNRMSLNWASNDCKKGPKVDEEKELALHLKSNLPPSISANVTMATEAGEGPRSIGNLMSRYFQDQMFQGRVQLLRRLYSGGRLVTQDDSALDLLQPFNSSSISSQSWSSNAQTWSNASSEMEAEFPFRGQIFRRRRGSCESGFFSSCPWTRGGTASRDGLSHLGCFDVDCGLLNYSISARSAGSSLLTVSDLEEDLRAASRFLSGKRDSSVFTDSMDDLSSLTDAQEQQLKDLESQDSAMPNPENQLGRSPTLSNQPSVTPPLYPVAGSSGFLGKFKGCYEKDIREIVEYFEKSCNVSRIPSNTHQRELNLLFGGRQGSAQEDDVEADKSLTNFQQASVGVSGPLALRRSQKIECLIKRVVEKESRGRFRKAFVSNVGSGGGHVGSSSTMGAAKMFQQQQQQRLQVCDGIVRSKLPLFDASKRSAIQRSKLGEHHKPGQVKSRRAIFDSKCPIYTSQVDQCQSTHSGNAKRLAEKRLQALANASTSICHKEKDG